MKEGPDIARIAALIGDPARANMLSALMGGQALTATELAAEAGITASTASGHLAKLQSGGLIGVRSQGRHKYFALAHEDVGQTLERMMGLAAVAGHMRSRPGPKDPALRKSRVCYNHLAGDFGIRLYESLLANSHILEVAGHPELTAAGAAAATDFGIDTETLRQPITLSCLDWSERRSHLAGSLGRAYLSRFESLGWAMRQPESRVINFTSRGETEFFAAFPLPA
ncbi:ArsR/SmtB family transcription factor [Algicella marina]|uniref:Helix-turn-helix domain-containing protein n=1 Tax=Algicella marina TaxID=2683284 RepID=A0A6P1SUY2_9RHOB|nr:winged helix-turn-helix domain-containing protein [Algicella marina]QHQ34258.1 helix-turn-helix domain-containing protein [Algicella marina]